MKSILQHSVEQAFGELINSGVIRELVSKAMNQTTTFESRDSGTVGPDGYEKPDDSQPPPPYTPERESEDGATIAKKSTRRPVCHQVSSYGSAFGCVWVRTSTVHVKGYPLESKASFQTVTSFIIYPASWLKRLGVDRGLETSVANGPDGWQFQFNPIRAVSESSLIFELARSGELRSVELLITKGLASVLDTSPKGWTALHVRLTGN
jgi:hypothetical protein